MTGNMYGMLGPIKKYIYMLFIDQSSLCGEVKVKGGLGVCPKLEFTFEKCRSGRDTF